MKLARLLTFLTLASPALAQNATCTPDVPRETCKVVSALFAVHQIRSDIVLAEPASFRREEESLNRRMETKARFGDFRNPTVPNSYSKDILFIRGNETCPTRVVISTDEFRPVSIEEGAKGESAVVRGEGFDATTVLHKVSYIHGFVEGCLMGQLTYFSDESNKPRKRN